MAGHRQLWRHGSALGTHLYHLPNRMRFTCELHGPIVKKKIWSEATRVARWLIPVAILFVIFRSIDWHRFVSVLSHTNNWLLIAGTLYFPLVILVGAVRWHTTLRAYHGGQVHYTTSLKDYWSGLAIGVFAPASLGWDVYRVTVSTKRYGNVIANSATIVVEKIMALLTCASLVTLLVPFMNIAADNRELQQIIKTTYFVLVGTLGVLSIAFLMARHGGTIRFFQSISDRLIQLLDRLSQQKDLLASQKTSLAVTFAPLRRPDILLRVTIFSLLIQLTSAVGNQIFFIAMNYDLPLYCKSFCFSNSLFYLPSTHFLRQPRQP